MAIKYKDILYKFNTPIIVILVIVAIFLFVLLSTTIQKSGIESNAIVASATIVLALITFRYAITTDRLLEESQVTRKVKFIERRLEKLYCPLKDVLQNTKKENNINLEKIDHIIPFQYLASKELENPLNEFIKKAKDDMYIHEHDCKPYEIVDDEIKKKVDEDIDNLNNELKKLIKL
jgi:hypothetical protein